MAGFTYFDLVGRIFRRHWPLFLLLALHFAVRWFVIQTPVFSESVMDEAIVGLIAMAAQHGQGQVFLWGQAYMGNLGPWSASVLFSLMGPSILALRLTLVMWSTLTLVALYGFGRQVGGRWGRGVGFWAAAWWALPPIAGSFVGLFVTGGHSESLALSTAALWGCSTLAFGEPRRPWLVALLTGLAGGLAFYSSLLAAPLLLAGALGVLAARPRLLLDGPAWLGLAGFALGSAPFWWWNFNHQWLALAHFHAGHSELWNNFLYLLQNVWAPILVGRWWNSHSVEWMVTGPLRWTVWLIFYLPALTLLVWRGILWVGWLWRRRAPWQQPLDLACLALWLALFTHASSQFGHSCITRYAAMLTVPLAVIVAYWLVWLQRRSSVLGMVLACGLLTFNAYTHVLFLQSDAGKPRRQVDKVIRKLEELGFKYCFAHGCIAYPIWFESQGRIVAGSFGGYRNYAAFLEANAASKVALVSRPGFGVSPLVWRRALKALGTSFQETMAGPYHIFHGFQAEPALRPLKGSGLRVEASVGGDLATALVDRDPLTSWSSQGVAGANLTLDLGRVVPVARVTLLPALGEVARVTHLPALRERGNGRTVTLSLLLSRDGEIWRTVVRRGTALTGLVWYGAHPRKFIVPAVQLTFPAQPARYMRLVLDDGVKHPRAWRFCEIFVDRPGQKEDAVPPVARHRFLQARKELYRYYDYPAGPYPGLMNKGLSTMPFTVRNHKVAWLYVFARLREAMNSAPNWDEPYLLWLRAVQMGDWYDRLLLPAWDGLVLGKREATAFRLRPAGQRTKALLVSGEGELSYKGWGMSGRAAVRADQGLRLEVPVRDAGSKALAERLVVRCLVGRLLLRPQPGYTVLKEQCWTVLRQAEDTPFRVGRVVADSRARGGRCLLVRPGKGQPTLLRLCLRPYFAKGAYRACFRLRGRASDGKSLVALEVLGRALGKGTAMLAAGRWAGAADGRNFQYVFLPFKAEDEPLRLELRVRHLENSPLWLDELGVLPACAQELPIKFTSKESQH